MKNKSNLMIALISGGLLSNQTGLINITANPFSPIDPIFQAEALRIFHTKEMKKLEQRADDFLNYRVTNFNEDSKEILLARMMLGETEDCSDIEKISVGYTAINRTKWGMSLKEVILYPKAYSCFNSRSKSSVFLKKPLEYNKSEFLKCLKISRGILNGEYKDPTKGATFFYNPELIKKPYWTKNLIRVGKIKNSHHVFYRESRK